MAGRKLRARKGSGVADQILQNLPEGCDLKIICEGNQVVLDQLTPDQSPPPSPSPSPLNGSGDRSTSVQESNGSNGSVSCMCFRSKFIWWSWTKSYVVLPKKREGGGVIVTSYQTKQPGSKVGGVSNWRYEGCLIDPSSWHSPALFVFLLPSVFSRSK